MILGDLNGFLNFRPMFNVVGCYLVRQGHILMLKRHPDKPQGGLWCVPGGKIKHAESIWEAAIREFKEETGCDLPQDLNCRTFCPLPEAVRYPDYDFLYFMLKVELPSNYDLSQIVINPAEHIEYGWVPLWDVMRQRQNLPLVPDEEECLRRLFKW